MTANLTVAQKRRGVSSIFWNWLTISVT